MKRTQNAAETDRKTMLRIMVTVGVLMVLILPVLFYNLYQIQIRDQDGLRELAVEQQTRDMLISPIRGVIYDRNKKALAVSATVETIVLSPAEIKNDAEAEAIAKGLAAILGLDEQSILEKTKNKKSYYEVVARKVEKEISDQVRQLKTENRYNGIKLFEDTKRYYPYATLLSSVIGFTNAYDNIGQYGLEYKYEEILKGTVGRIITAKNNRGSDMPFYYEQYYDAQDGLSLITTIDFGVQEILEKHLEIALESIQPAQGVRAIVMEPKTGKILGMAQKGDYDLNNPRVVADSAVAEQILALPEAEQNAALLEALMGQWRNKAIQEPYEPGSVFKAITAAIALEENVVNANSTFYCSGRWSIGTSTSGWCWRHSGHGSQNFAKAVQNSCNCAFVDIGLRLGSTRFYNYFISFGLTEKTNIDLMGEVGPVEGVHYHTREVFTNPLYGGDVSLGVYSFGQTFKITPIQMITAFSAAINGGYLMQPYVVSAFADSSGNIVESFEPTVVRQVVSSQTSAQVRALMESVVAEGTGSNAYVRGYRVGGKTGTSNKRDKENELGGNFYIASFCGVAPCSENPEVVVLVLIDEPPPSGQYMGGQIAAPLVGRIMNDLLPYLNVKVEYTSEELEKLAVEVPLAIGASVSFGKAVIQQAGFNVIVVGDGDKITGQYPKSKSKIPNTATVILYAGVEKEQTPVVVPNLVGRSLEDAVRILDGIGLYAEIDGIFNLKPGDELIVTGQSPQSGAGATVTYGSVIQLQFYEQTNVGE